MNNIGQHRGGGSAGADHGDDAHPNRDTRHERYKQQHPRCAARIRARSQALLCLQTDRERRRWPI